MAQIDVGDHVSSRRGRGAIASGLQLWRRCMLLTSGSGRRRYAFSMAVKDVGAHVSNRRGRDVVLSCPRLWRRRTLSPSCGAVGPGPGSRRTSSLLCPQIVFALSVVSEVPLM